MNVDTTELVNGAIGADRMALTVDLGRALHRFGAPVDRIEATMEEVSARLGLRGEFFVAPTSIHVAFGPPGRQHAFLARVSPATDTDLGRLGRLDRLAGDLIAGKVGVRRAQHRLGRILAAPPRHRRAVVTLAYGLLSASAARVLQGGLHEVLLAGAVGLVIGAAALSLATRPRIAPVFGALAALVAGFASGAAAAVGLTTAPWIVTLGALIVLVPGLTLTLAMREVATGHLAAGTARLTGAMATFLALGCGIAIADQLANNAFAIGALDLRGTPSLPLPGWTELLAYGASAVAFVALFQCPRSDFPWLLLGCLCALAGTRLGDVTLGARLAPFVGALSVGMAGNIYARIADRPAVIPMLPGLLLLVPGSLGVRSLSALLADDVVGGMSTAFAMAFIAAALVSGLLVANVFVAPRRSL
jgi:uncharacterized membrane protein YjjP (DUF1212 family)